MKIAIMQPYFMPYLGYFQLINEVDKFIFYDDVNYIKGGWINRNFITINGELKRFTIPLKNSSSIKKIKDTYVDWDCRNMQKLIKTFNQNLKKDSVSIKIIEEIIDIKPKTISEMSILSINLTFNNLGIKTLLKKSSDIEYKKTNNRILNLINICKLENCDNYLNSEGGQHLYNKNDFISHNINLNFLRGSKTASIIDIIDDPNISNKLKDYSII